MALKKYQQYIILKNNNIKEFGITIPFLDIVGRICLKFKFYKYSHYLTIMKNKRINNFLEAEFSADFISKADDELYIEKVEKIVWTCWWQGEKNAPVLVKQCISNLRKYANGYKVIVITKDNYKKYLKLNPIFIKKLECEKITLTHFSDIIRIALLKEHGGIWFDSTCYTFKSLPENIFSLPIFMGREKDNLKCKNYLTHLTQKNDLGWHLYVLGGNKNNLLFSLVYDLLLKYWERYDSLIDYFLIDYLVYFIYSNVKQVRNQIDSISENMGVENSLQELLNIAYDETIAIQLKESKDIFFKLSYKKNLCERTQSGDTTFYYHLFSRS